MTDAEPTGFREVSAPVSAAVQVPEEEEEKVEDTESGNSDDDEDMDDINHAARRHVQGALGHVAE
jgi:hypothetical protein